MAFNLYRAIYFGSVSVMGYLALKDSPDLPYYFGGKGSIDNWFKGYPYQETSTAAKNYLIFTMGYHISNNILCLIEER